MTSSPKIRNNDFVRRVEYVWRYGDLAPRIARGLAVVLILVLSASLWQARQLHRRELHLEDQVNKLQDGLAVKERTRPAADWLDVVQTLPDAPSAAQVMQTLQQAADKEGGTVVSLQSDDHLPTETTLGHLDLVIAVKATYPEILIMLREVLDRYPGATLRQFDMVHTAPQAVTTPPAIQPANVESLPASETEARVLLSFWRRPVGVLARSAPLEAASATTARGDQESPNAAPADAAGTRPASSASSASNIR